MANPKPKHKFPKGNKFGGRPRKPDFRTVVDSLPPEIKEIVLKHIETGQELTPDQLYAFGVLHKAGTLDMGGLRELGDRLYGKAHQSVEVDQTVDDKREHKSTEEREKEQADELYRKALARANKKASAN